MGLLSGFVVMACSSRALKTALRFGLAGMAGALKMALLLGLAVKACHVMSSRAASRCEKSGRSTSDERTSP